MILILQTVGFVTALMFGAFAILSWKMAEKATEQANMANMISFLSLCAQITQNDVCRHHSPSFKVQLTFSYTFVADLCTDVSAVAEESLSSYAASAFPTPTESSGSPNYRASMPGWLTATGVIIPSTIIFMSGGAMVLIIRARRRLHPEVQPYDEQKTPVVDSPYVHVRIRSSTI